MAVKIFGPDLDVLEKKAVEIETRLDNTPGFTELTVVRELGQPSLIVDADRAKIARYGINVADVEAVVQAAIGGQAATQVIQGEKLFDLVVRMEPQYRSSAREIGNLLVPAPGRPADSALRTRDHQGRQRRVLHLSRKQFALHRHSVFREGRDLEGIVNAGQAAVNKAVQLPEGYHLDWGGEYSELLEAKSQFIVIGPLARSADFHDSVRALRQLQISHHHRARRRPDRTRRRTDRAQTHAHALQRIERPGIARPARSFRRNRRHSRQLHQQASPRRQDVRDATLDASLLRLRPIMMTALVACLGLLPAAMSTGVGSDTQKPFAIVVVAGLVSRLLLGFFVNPVLYEIVAREGDVLQV